MDYLLAAEADKIQDLIFRSSRLREVVGGSQLLSAFHKSSNGIKQLLNTYSDSVEEIVNDGGSFRFRFSGPQAESHARQFAEELAELYRLALDSSLSVGEPVPVASNPTRANQTASEGLRRAKRGGAAPAAEAHMSFVALCASCGSGLAERYGTLPSEDRLRGMQGRYLCRACQDKAASRSTARGSFLGDFLTAVVGDKEATQGFTWPDNADSLAGEDSRNYVAYLTADGNAMGELFDNCPLERLAEFSNQLTDAVRRSLADATQMLLAQSLTEVTNRGEKQKRIPVLPLLLGGDDLFALLPAPWAIDFARHFCLSYEVHVGKLVRSIPELANQRATVGAAVIICKGSYPYKVAHTRAKALLEEAKKLSKSHRLESGEALSAIAFEVILGSTIEERGAASQMVKPTLAHYWVSDFPLSDGASALTVEIATLLTQRYALRNLPSRRLNEVRRRFNEVLSIRPDVDTQLHEWSQRLDAFLARSGEQAPVLRFALESLGQRFDPSDPTSHWWRRGRNKDDIFYRHGLPDVIKAWDFLLEMNRPRRDYESDQERQP